MRLNLQICFRIFVFLFVFLLFSRTELSAETKVAIFSGNSSNIGSKALLLETTKQVYKVFNELGRVIPIKLKNVSAVLEDNSENSKSYQELAKELNAQIYVVINVFIKRSKVLATVNIVSLTKQYSLLNKKYNVKTLIPKNISSLVGIKIASLHRLIPLKTSIIENSSNYSLIDSGQWNGLSVGNYKTDKGEIFNVKRVSRFNSLVLFKKRKKKGFSFIIDDISNYKNVIKWYQNKIKENTINRYIVNESKLNGLDPEKRFFQSLLIINPGSNILLPGYGSYLSTGTMGFTNPKLDENSLGITTAVFLTQLMYIPVTTKFDANFFPWIKDGDKSSSQSRLHSYLWWMLPITFTASYMDQLSYQFKKNKSLPPFFHNSNTTAFLLSTFFPGTGHFYKGNKKNGWIYYTLELSLGGGFFYYGMNSKKGKFFLASFLLVKIIDVTHAYFSNSNYDFYENEKDEAYKNIDFSLNLEKEDSGGSIVNFAVSNKF